MMQCILKIAVVLSIRIIVLRSSSNIKILPNPSNSYGTRTITKAHIFTRILTRYLYKTSKVE